MKNNHDLVRLLLHICCFLFCLNLQAQLEITSAFYQDSLSNWYDCSATMQWTSAPIELETIAQIESWQALPDKAAWANTWLRLSIENGSKEAIGLALLLHYDEWTAWWQEAGTWQQRQAGSLIPKKLWDSQLHEPIFSSPHTLQFDLSAQSNRTIFIQLKRNDNQQPFQPQLIRRDSFINYSTQYFQRTIATQGMVQAALLMMMLYHLFLFFVNRQRTYLTYSLYIFFLAILLFYSFGMHYLTPLSNFPRWSRILLIASTYGYMAVYAEFLRQFMQEQWYSSAEKILRYLSITSLTWGVLNVVLLLLPIELFPMKYSYALLLLAAPVGLAVIIWVSWKYWNSGNQQARSIALTNAFLLIGVLISTLILYGGTFEWWDMRRTSFWGILFLEATIILHLLSFAVSLSYRGLAIERERTQLRELDHLKSRFFASISHEFRTPLTLILGPVQQLKATINQSASRSHLYLIETYAQRLLQMVNQILDLTRLEAKQLELTPKIFDVAQIGRSLLHSFESLAKEKNIELYFHAQPEVQRVFLDPTKTEQILINLIDNAIKYNRPNGTVTVHSNIEQEQWKLIVQDNGQGIPASELADIFQLYYRANDAHFQTRQASSGIGLAWVKQLVEWQSGSVAVESEVDKGSTFTIQIPLPALPENEATEYKFSLTNPMTQSIDEQAEKVTAQPLLLIVEDHPDIQWYINDCLVKDYQLKFAKDGLAGLEIAKKEVPDLILTDVMMPKMDGFELVQQLKSDIITSHIPIIILTGKSSKASRISGLATEADDYLTKPFQADELQLRIRNLLNNRKRWSAKYEAQNGVIQRVALPSMEEQFLTKASEIVKTHLSDEHFGVEQLGKAMHLDRTQLFRKLKALTNENPSAFIRIIRLNAAHELLQQNTATIAEVAFQVGFSNTSYFSRTFKTQFGKTPGEVREEKG